jgi:hypothetical protein
MTMPFDTLKLARRLEAAGFPVQQAGDMAEAIAEALSQLATKADIALLKADLAQFKADLEHAVRELIAADRELEQRLTIRLGSMMIVAVGVILAGIKFIH